MDFSLPIEFPLSQPSLTFTTSEGSTVRRTVLPNGVRVLTESTPGTRSTTVGYWVPVGSRDEQPGFFGSTHFLEHLLFKGTTTRSALDIAVAFDEVGGESNAMTAKEYTCYYAKVLDRDLPMSVEVLTDMVANSTIDPGEFENERQVILEELAMAADDPSDVAHEAFASLVFGDHSLGRPIGGTPESIEAIDRDAVWTHYRTQYHPSTLVVAAAGSVDHDAFVALVSSALARSPWGGSEDAAPAVRRSETRARIDAAIPSAVVPRPGEQEHLILGTRSITASDDRKFAMSALSSALGGGMSSRLFQQIRERRGLAYSVYSFAGAYADTGYFGMYAGCSPAKSAQVLHLMREGLREVAAEGITEEELTRARGQLSGSIALGFEDSSQLMSRLGRAEIGRGEFLDLEGVFQRIREVSREQVRALAEELAEAPAYLAAVGPVGADELQERSVQDATTSE